MSTAIIVPELSVNSVVKRLTRQIASFPGMLVTLLIALAVLTVRSRFDDPDLWWHLKMGEVISRTHAIPSTDIFSYTTNHHAYTAHEWLSQVVLYNIYRWGSYPGLMLWLCITTSVLLILGYILCSMYSGNAKVAFLGALVIWFFSTIGLALRPQMIGYPLLILELLLLHLGRTRNPRWFFGLPPLFALWINCHGSFFLGLAVAITFACSTFIHCDIGSLTVTLWSSRSRRWLLSALGLSLLCLFLNPAGPKPILYPLETMINQPLGLSQVAEWQPTQLGDVRGQAMLAVLVCIFLLPVLRGSKLFWHELMFLALGTFAAASHQRMLFAFGILAAPILSRLLSDAWDSYVSDQDRPLINAAFIAVTLLVTFWAFPSRSMLESQVAQQSPVTAVQFIKEHHLSGPIVNDYVYGGYLIWAAPEYPVFIDGRADVFEFTGILAEYGRWVTLQEAPNVLLDKHRINLCVLPRESQMSTVLRLLPNWKMIHSDDHSVIFTRIATPAAAL